MLGRINNHRSNHRLPKTTGDVGNQKAKHMTDLNITAAAIEAITEMETALNKFRAVIALSRKNLEEELIAPMNMDTVTLYAHLLAAKEPPIIEERGQKQKREELARIREDNPF
jgi:hypothetical protein